MRHWYPDAQCRRTGGCVGCIGRSACGRSWSTQREWHESLTGQWKTMNGEVSCDSRYRPLRVIVWTAIQVMCSTFESLQSALQSRDIDGSCIERGQRQSVRAFLRWQTACPTSGSSKALPHHHQSTTAARHLSIVHCSKITRTHFQQCQSTEGTPHLCHL